MNDEDRAKIRELYEEDELSERAARELLGEDDFERVQQIIQNDEIVSRTPDPEPDDDNLFFDDNLGDRDE